MSACHANLVTDGWLKSYSEQCRCQLWRGAELVSSVLAVNWQRRIDKDCGMVGLGTAYATGKLKFNVGDDTAVTKGS